MSVVIIGIDPSSRKLAAVISIMGDEANVEHITKPLPQDKPVACLMAFEWVRALVDRHTENGHEVYVFIELPVLGRGGPGSTIPQAQINGALLAGAHMANAEVVPVNNSRAKKEVIGRGNANKDDIRVWVSEAWPDLYAKIEKDQDLCDSAMIYVFGKQIIERRDKIATKKNLDGVSVKRRGKVTDD
jgi:Holliday junction resolvasome RuvABC endonuclease subunit